MYAGNFTCWNDVKNAFRKDIKQPTEVYLAWYDVDGYEGSAIIVYRRGRKYGIATGSHCSCHGLEECTWDPELYDKKTFKKLLKDRTPYRLPDEFVQEMLKKIG
jgi:hypothetical protein